MNERLLSKHSIGNPHDRVNMMSKDHPFTKSEFSSIHTIVSNSAVMHPITSTVLIFNLLINLIKPKIDKQETTESYHF